MRSVHPRERLHRTTKQTIIDFRFSHIARETKVKLEMYCPEFEVKIGKCLLRVGVTGSLPREGVEVGSAGYGFVVLLS